MINQNVLKYETACLDMATEFVNGFYQSNDPDHPVETQEEVLERFVGMDMTGIIELADMYINISNIYTFYDSGATYDEFRDWYWEVVEGKMNINLRNYLKLK